MFDIDRLYSFSRVDVCVGAKSPMFLESYGGDGCDCDDQMMNDGFDSLHGDVGDDED